MGRQRSTVKDDAKPKVTKKSEKSKKAATREVPQPSAGEILPTFTDRVHNFSLEGKDDNYTIPIVARMFIYFFTLYLRVSSKFSTNERPQ